MYSIEFNNRTDDEFDIYAIKRPNVPCAEREKEDISIKGSDETLTRYKNDGYKNITISIDYNFKDTDDFNNKCRRIKKWLCGTIIDRKLRLSDDDDVYYIVKNVKLGNIERTYKILGKFTVEFECSPYAWLNSGQVDIEIPSSGKQLYNDYLLCKPEWYFEGEGTVNVRVNGKLVIVKVGQNVTINTTLQKCYKGNKVISLSLESGNYQDLWLQEGENHISWEVKSGKINLVSIIPNYKTL